MAKEEIIEDFKKFGIGEILAQFIMNDDARALVNEYIQSLENIGERWKRANEYNLNACINQSDLIIHLRKELKITQNNYDMLQKDHQYLIADFVKLQDERGVLRGSD